MVQKTVNFTQKLGFEGQLITCNYGAIRGQALRKYYNKTNAVIPFGRVVVKAAGSKENVQLPSAAGTTPEGIVIFNDFLNNVLIDDLAKQGYQPDSMVSVLRGGAIDIVVWSEVATDVDDPVFYRHATADAVNLPLGRFTNVTSANHTAWTNARFVYKTTGAGLTIINIGGL